LPVFSFGAVLAEEEETEDPIPESYYYTIESNEIEGWPQGPAVESAAAVVMDLDTGVFLYSKNATATMYPASTTKILTTLLLVENCDLKDTITYSGIVYDLEEGSSHLGIQPGEEMLLKDAAYGIMLASANDISNGVAEYMGGSLSGFADMMNAKAEELGCVNSHFANPHGLYQDDHYTCAQDMALIAQAAYNNSKFRKIAGTKEYTIPETNLVEEQRSFLNHHKMLLCHEHPL
jgi:D-alanyl-D-alanine carboxypeptidase